MPGLGSQGAEQGQRLEAAATRMAAATTNIVTTVADEVGEERQVELAPFQQLHQLQPALEIRIATSLHLRAPPGIAVGAVQLHKGRQYQLPFAYMLHQYTPSTSIKINGIHVMQPQTSLLQPACGT